MKIFDTFPCRNKEQLIIMTQNKDAVLCFKRSARIGFKQNVPKIDKDEIVDTIGGGDAFAGRRIEKGNYSDLFLIFSFPLDWSSKADFSPTT